MKPPQEARPIQLHWLGGAQREAVEDVHRAIFAIVEENREAPKAAARAGDDELWADIDPRRSNRALFIDGPRGMGKSSVLVTLLHGWREAAHGDAGDWSAFALDAKDARNATAEATAMFMPVAGLVRALPIRDFNPLADDMPLRAWLLQSFLDIAVKADEWEQRPPRPDGPAASTEHADEWSALFRKAIAGWESVRSPARPVLEQIVDHRMQVQSGFDFGIRFRRFLDGIFSSAQKAGLVPSRDTIIVIPIDDLDLQTDRVRELLDAVRLLHHPRLLWLCVGDWNLMSQAVADDIVGTALRQRGGQRLPATRIERAKALAHSLCAKTFPRRLELRQLTLSEVLSAMGGRAAAVLDVLKSDRSTTPCGPAVRAL